MKRVSILTILILSSAYASAQCETGLTKIRDFWVQNWNGKNLDAVMELYAPDATYLSIDGKRITGREDIKTFFKRLMDSGDTEEVHSSKSGCSGDMGYDSGEFTGTAGGGSTGSDGKKSHGNYLVVARKVGSKWLLVQHASILTPDWKDPLGSH